MNNQLFTYKLTEKDREIAALKDRYYRLTEHDKLEKLRDQYEQRYCEHEKEPKILVYTPTYNRGEIFIKRALQAVLAQSYTNFEYLIVGDCCTDDTAEIVSQVKDPRITFYNIPERGYRYPPTVENHWLAGPITAANYALSHVPQDVKWIARIDDDDMWTIDHLESVLKFAQDGNWEFVTSEVLTERDGIQKIERGELLYSEYFRLDLPKEQTYNPRIASTNTVLYRSYLKAFQYNEDCWRKEHNRTNDIDLFVRLGLAGVRMGHLDKVTCNMIPRPGETTIGSDAYKRDAVEKEKHFEFK